jgi:glyoxylase-like metal-dependent hydrolase (beta-lactamase superfamily II)
MTVIVGRDTAVDMVTVGPFQENTFFLRPVSSPDTVIIDPGDEADRLISIIASHGWKPVAIVNTHAHLDHIGAVDELRHHFNVPFYLHPGDVPTLKEAPEHACMFGVRAPVVPTVDHELAHGQYLDLAGLRIQVLHTPGHTPGGVSFAVDGRVFAGDALFYGSIGRTDLPGGDYEMLMRSLKERLLTLPDDTIVHSGHGPDTTIGRERRHNPFLMGDVGVG